MRKDTFDPEDISQEDMDYIATQIEDYVNELEETMIIPEEIIEDVGDQIDEGIRRAKKLIKKLRKGDRSVFKDEEEWNPVC